MTTEYLFYFLVLALIAEVIGTIGGFGSSLFFVPMASLFLDFSTVLGITAIFHVSSNISKIALFRQGIDKRLILSVGIPAVIFVIIGALLTRFIDSQILEYALAIFLILVSIVLFVFQNRSIPPSSWNAFLGGSCSGFLAGLLGTGGAIRGITLTAFGLGKDVFIATSAVIDLAVDFSRSVVYASNGFVHIHDLYLIPILFIVSFAGSYIGKKILENMSEQQFRTIVLGLVFLTGLVTLLKGFLF